MLDVTRHENDYFELRVHGALEKTDYEKVVPQLEQAAEHQKLRVLVKLDDFRGWKPNAIVDELRYDIRHRGDFEKVAVVGSKKVEELATKVSRPFFSGDVRFFEDETAARQWVRA
jgi:hypothetical protein